LAQFQPDQLQLNQPLTHLVLSRTPLRLSLGGGGTDLPHFYKKHGSFIITSAIQKYIYVIAKPWFEEGIRVSYSKTEHASCADEIDHPVVREAIKLFGPKKHIEIASMADLPARTGMGSSASFTVGLINTLFALNRKSIDAHSLAEQAFNIQSNILSEIGGKQDQYAAAFGGIVGLTIERSGNVLVRELQLDHEILEELEDNLMCFSTGIKRESSDIQSSYVKPTTTKDDQELKVEDETEDVLLEIKQISLSIAKALRVGSFAEFGWLLHRHWLAKRSLSNSISNSLIDMWYNKGLNAGAMGGKIMGAGGGGFLVFYCENGRRKDLRRAMCNEGLREVKLRFEFGGSKIVANI